MSSKAELEGGGIASSVWRKGVRFAIGTLTGTGSGNISPSLTYEFPPILNVDPNGGAGDLLLPLATDKQAKGLMFFITNTADAAEAITLKTSADGALSPAIDIAQNESAIVWCDGAVWKGGVLKNT